MHNQRSARDRGSVFAGVCDESTSCVLRASNSHDSVDRRSQRSVGFCHRSSFSRRIALLVATIAFRMVQSLCIYEARCLPRELAQGRSHYVDDREPSAFISVAASSAQTQLALRNRTPRYPPPPSTRSCFVLLQFTNSCRAAVLY